LFVLITCIILIAIPILGPSKNTDFDTKIQHLVQMGIECDRARRVLSTVNWNLKQATKPIIYEGLMEKI